MHVCDVTMFYTAHGGGVRRYLRAKRRWAANHAGERYTLLSPGGAAAKRGNHWMLPAPMLPFSHGYRFPLRRAPWVETLLELAPDVIEAGDPYSLARAALMAADRLGVPATAFMHSDLSRLVEQRFGSWAGRRAQKYLLNLYAAFDAVQVPSLGLANRMRELGLHQVVWQPLGVDAEKFNPALHQPLVREWLKLKDEVRLLVFAGRYAREKNIDILLEAMRLLGADYHLLLIGPDMPPSNLPNVTAHGEFCDSVQLAHYLASADAMVHAGDQETFGLIVLEGMASGLPVVGVRGGALPELITPEVGMLAEPRDATSFAQAVRDLFTQDWPSMGLAARQRVDQNFRWDVVFAQQHSFYHALSAGTFRAHAFENAREVSHVGF
ncbi:MAG TPA: glycosyltransferase family 1 protein [bacterium]|nr:glycosyltransferase family 1 protein [bacterium]